jgi:hypothetical protein
MLPSLRYPCTSLEAREVEALRAKCQHHQSPGVFRRVDGVEARPNTYLSAVSVMNSCYALLRLRK